MNIFHQPWTLVPNHIRGKGGREIDKLRGVTPALDTDSGSEAWIGSVTRVGNPPPEAPNYGCSEVVLPDGRREFLFEAIAENPQEILGQTHMRKNGQGLGMLIKYLDAQAQYGLQCHPTRPWAKKMWNSPYGKEESWYVIGTRDDTAEPAYILLGFQEGVTREMWEEAYFRDDLAALENLCHKIQVQVGEAYFVGGGCPHALGEGCLVVEVQEPADITLGAHPYSAMPAAWRQKNPDVPAGLYDERLLGAYVYDGCSYEENLRRWRAPRVTARKGGWGSEEILIGPAQTKFFSFTELNLAGETEMLRTGFPQVAMVLSGQGELFWEGGSLPVKQGMELFFPYDIPSFGVRGELRMVLCNPEGAEIPMQA